MSNKHCVDCCCDQSWKALGVTEYTGKSIPEHITAITEERDRLKKALKAVSDIYCDDNYHDWCGCITKAANIADEALTPQEVPHE